MGKVPDGVAELDLSIQIPCALCDYEEPSTIDLKTRIRSWKFTRNLLFDKIRNQIENETTWYWWSKSMININFDVGDQDNFNNVTIAGLEWWFGHHKCNSNALISAMVTQLQHWCYLHQHRRWFWMHLWRRLRWWRIRHWTWNGLSWYPRMCKEISSIVCWLAHVIPDMMVTALVVLILTNGLMTHVTLIARDKQWWIIHLRL